MAQFNYYLKSNKSVKKTLISLRITHSSKSTFISTGLKVEPKHWCFDKSHELHQRVLKNRGCKDYQQINNQLEMMLLTAKKAEASFGNELFSIHELKNRILDFLERKHKSSTPNIQEEISFYQFWDEFVKELKTKINPNTNKKVTYHTFLSLNQTKKVIQRFEKYTRLKVDFTTIDIDFYNRFNGYCVEVEKFRTNTFGKHISNLKRILNSAELKGKAVKQDYKTPYFRNTRELTTSIFLNEKEIEDIIKLDLSCCPGLDRTRDFFVIGCYTGLRWGDFTNLNSADFSQENQIRIKTSKTQQKLVIPILPNVKSTLEKYRQGEKYVFPKPISNQKFNSQLKEITKRIPILQTEVNYVSNIGGRQIIETYPKWMRVTSHTCRRSFATNMYLRNIDVLLIRKLTGHKSERIFFDYIKIDEIEVANNFMTQYEKSLTSFLQN
jgi:integrase